LNRRDSPQVCWRRPDGMHPLGVPEGQDDASTLSHGLGVNDDELAAHFNQVVFGAQDPAVALGPIGSTWYGDWFLQHVLRPGDVGLHRPLDHVEAAVAVDRAKAQIVTPRDMKRPFGVGADSQAVCGRQTGS
jgi:hypothetical protein